MVEVEPTADRVANGNSVKFQCSPGFHSSDEMERVCRNSKLHPDLTRQPIVCYQGNYKIKINVVLIK